MTSFPSDLRKYEIASASVVLAPPAGRAGMCGLGAEQKDMLGVSLSIENQTGL
jgi:hypothetical protein